MGATTEAASGAVRSLIPARLDRLAWTPFHTRLVVALGVAWVLLHALPPSLGWRLAFLVGPALALVVVVVRRNLPESPRWLLMHGRTAEAERTMAAIEARTGSPARALPPLDDGGAIEIRPGRVGHRALLRVLFVDQWRRSVLGATLMITQSFLYNAIFFTYVLVLTHFYGVRPADAPLYLLGFAAGNLLGPLTIGRLFDTIGRKQMIAGTYIASGVLLAITACLFDRGVLTAATQTLAWCVIFFFASAGASAAYLSVSEIFPLEVRARAIALFFAIAQCFGAVGPVLYGHLIGNGTDPSRLFAGYLIGGTVMIVGGLVEIALGVRAERKPLEAVALPLSAVPRTAVPRAAGAPTAFSPRHGA